MRDKVVFASVNSQMLSALAASESGTSAVPDAIVAVTLNVFGSIRASVPSPQAGVQRLPKAETIPPQALLRPATGSAILLVLTSILSRWSLAGTNTVVEKKIQSGLAGVGKAASIFRLENGI
jgi:hypothetical protein